MAITVKIAGTRSAVALSDASTEFVAIGPFVLYGDDFGVGESAVLHRLGPNGVFSPLTNKDGLVSVSSAPNSVYVEALGTYRITKSATAALASVGYEEQ